MSPANESIQPIVWRDDALELLDQRRLPDVTEYLRLTAAAAVAEAIRDMVVRGAPAIGISAAYGAVLAVRQRFRADPATWRDGFAADLDHLAQARPTAVNLHWAVARMRQAAATLGAADPEPELLALAQAIHAEDIAANRRMGELGAALLGVCPGVLTHCNAGALATGGYGTALGVIRSAHRLGQLGQVYADETRPWLQGARLTAWELQQDGIPVTLVVEGAAAHLMKAGKVSWVIVGSDRIAANGDVANKIGTYALAVAARYHGLRFMVAAPSSTIDMSVASGAEIPIERRAAEEVLYCGGRRVAAAGSAAWNPVFDITPAELVDAIVTERGVVERPDRAKMAALMGVDAA